MAAPVNAIQVGSYFVQQYYQILQQQPDFVYQFYNEASTLIRVDGNNSESASTMLQIHSLITSLNFTGIEIKTANSLDSWNGGVLVMVLGSVQTKDYIGRRKFAQTFFLAPQEKGYFVLNDIFHFLEEEQIHQLPAAILAQSHYDTKLNAPIPLQEPVSEYNIDGETKTREFGSSGHAIDDDSIDKYSLPEQQYSLPEQQYSIPEQQYSVPEQHYSIPEQQYSVPEQQQFSEADNVVEETPVEESTTSFSQVINPVQDPSPAPVEEAVAEPPKQTYASILRVAKGQSASSIAPRTTNRSVPPTSEWNHVPQPAAQQSYPIASVGFERLSLESGDVTTHEDEGEGRSVYVRNLSSTISAQEIEQEFKNFGTIKPDGVVIRYRKEIGVCYAFVEFEDSLGAQNAIKASSVELDGRQVHIEERRANSTSSSRGGGRRGRGRSSYPTESVRGRFGGRSYGRGSGQDGSDRDYRPRGNGFQQRVPRQERGILGNHVGRNGYNPSDDAGY